jgi:hypothetical protein
MSAHSCVISCSSKKLGYGSVLHDISRPFEAEALSCDCHQMATHSDQNNIKKLTLSCCLDLVFMRLNVMPSLIFADNGDIQSR